jgi:hypothetical protein
MRHRPARPGRDKHSASWHGGPHGCSQCGDRGPTYVPAHRRPWSPVRPGSPRVWARSVAGDAPNAVGGFRARARCRFRLTPCLRLPPRGEESASGRSRFRLRSVTERSAASRRRWGRTDVRPMLLRWSEWLIDNAPHPPPEYGSAGWVALSDGPKRWRPVSSPPSRPAPRAKSPAPKSRGQERCPHGHGSTDRARRSQQLIDANPRPTAATWRSLDHP